MRKVELRPDCETGRAGADRARGGRARPLVRGPRLSARWRPARGPLRRHHRTEIAEAALRESEERYRLIVENARDYAIFTTDLAGAVTDWRAGAANVFGYAAEEIVGRDASILYTPEERATREPERELAQAAETGSAPNVRWHRRKDGGRVFIEGVTSAIRGPGGELHGYLKIGQDVIGCRRTEEALRESEARLRRVLDIETVGVVFFDLVGGVQDANDAFLAMIGYGRAELEAREVRYETLTPPDWRWRDERTIAELEADGKAGPYEKEYAREDGSRIWTLCADKMLDERAALEFVIDVTERKRVD